MNKSTNALLAVSLLLSTSLIADSNNRFEIGIGVIGSDEQQDVLNAVYSDYASSGGGGMISLDIGYSFAVGKNISLVPKLTAAFFRVEFENSIVPGASSTSTNTYIMPGIALRYNFSEYNQGIYVGGQIATNSASSDLNRVQSIESDGLVTGLFVGYMFERIHIEIGTMNIPVKIEADSIPSTTADFGGVNLALRAAF
jgi:hypothetical protein